MDYAMMGILFGCLFFVPLWAYRRGLKDGLALNQGKQPEPIKSPVAAVRDYKQAKVEKKQNDQLTEGLINLLNYNGERQGGDK